MHYAHSQKPFRLEPFLFLVTFSCCPMLFPFIHSLLSLDVVCVTGLTLQPSAATVNCCLQTQSRDMPCIPTLLGIKSPTHDQSPFMIGLITYVIILLNRADAPACQVSLWLAEMKHVTCYGGLTTPLASVQDGLHCLQRETLKNCEVSTSAWIHLIFSKI